MNILRTLLLASGIAAASGPLLAQGQSAASAHGFFQAVVRSHPVLFTDFLMLPAPHTRDLVALESAGCVSRVTVQQPGREPVQTVVDWNRVDSVRVEGERDLRLRGRGVDTMLGLPSRDLAVRMGNALSMVRRECDPTAGYGF